MKKNTLTILISLLFLNHFYLNLLYSKDNIINGYNLSDSTLTDTITIIGVGDIMMGTNFPSSQYLPPNNQCEPLLKNVIHFISDADVSFANLEGCFSNNCPLVKKCNNPEYCFAFRMPEDYASCLKNAGFDILSLANNHSADFGNCGLESTMKILDNLEIKYAGLISHPIAIYEKDSIKYGFCAFSPNIGTCSITDYDLLSNIISQLKKSCDIIIVSFHGGAEGAKYQHVTKNTETFYGENRGDVFEFAHKAIDAGADVVFGQGPHVTRAIDIYKNRFIIYSLGNFCTYGRFNLSGPNGIAPIIKLFLKPDGEFISGKIIPVKQFNNGFVSLDNEKSIITKLQSLTSVDFPQGKVKILNNGNITLIK